MKGLTLRVIAYILSCSASIAVTIYLAVASERKWRPLPFSEFYLSASEVASIAAIMAAITMFFLLCGRALVTQKSPKEYFSLDYLNFLLAYTFSILYFLLASSITFNPNLFVYIGLYGSAFILLLHILFLQPQSNRLKELLSGIQDVLRRFTTLYGIIVLILFISPMALAIGFIFNSDVSDAITKIRLTFNKASSSSYTLKAALNSTPFRQPMIAKFSHHKNDIIYVLERAGMVYKVDYPSGNNKQLVLNIKDKVGLVDIENGALGLALHPNFGLADSTEINDIFIYYTSVHNEEQTNTISRFTLNEEVAPSLIAELPLLQLHRTNDAYHNGGSVEFGPDGYLYIALGEGVYKNKQKATNEALRAGILRIDVDNDSNKSESIKISPKNAITQHYRIPKDNPFINDNSVLNEYWVMGMRNPFRISFDAESGELWAGDVGSTVWEEVNKIEQGSNYLYPYIEGPQTSNFVTPADLKGTAKHPTYAYKHSAFDRAVIGGVVYRGKQLNELNGTYIYGDNFSGKLFGIPTDGSPIKEARLLGQAEQYAQRGISSLSYAPNGEVFVTLLGSKTKDSGQLMVLTHSSDDSNKTQSTSKNNEAHVYSYEETNSIFLESCGRCHGNEGKGDGPDSKLFAIKIADFTTADYSSKRSNEEIINIISDGGAAHGLSPYMPPWGMVLSKDEISDLSKYITSKSTQE